MPRKRRRFGVMGKLVASYVALLLLPILIIWLYLFPQIEQRMVETTLNSQENNVSRLASTIDMSISSMIVSAVEFANNPQLSSYAIQKDAMGEYEAIREIKKILTPGGLISHYFYYLFNSNRFYTNTAVYPFDWLTNTQYGYCYLEWPPDEMYDTLQSIKSIQVRPLERVEYPNNLPGNVVTIMLPIPMNSTSPYAVLMIWVDEAELNRLIVPMSGATPDSVFLYDGTGQRVFAYHGGHFPMEAGALDALLEAQPDNVARVISVGGSSYIYAASTQGSAQWKCVSLFPLDALMEEVNAVRLNIILIIAILIIASIVIIAIAVRSHYMPIRTLATKAGQYVSPGRPANEFDVVHNALDHLNTQTQALQSRMRDSLPMLREQHLYALVGGHYDTIEAFNAAGADIGLTIHGPVLCAALLRTNLDDPSDVLDYLEKQADIMPSGTQAFYALAFNRRDTLFVCAGQNIEGLALFIADTCEDVSATFGCTICAAIGRGVETAKDVQLSYSDAVSCLDKMILMGWQGVKTSDSTVDEGTIASFSQLYQIDFAIAKLDGGQIERHLDTLLDSIYRGDYSTAMVRSLYSHIVASLMRGLETVDKDTGPYMDYMRQAATINYDGISTNLRTLSRALIDQMDREEEKTGVAIEQVLAYIEANCLEYAFSIQAVAEHFGMSYSGFSHFFKRSTGISCKKYVDEYRAEQAIDRIMNTMDSLDSIALSLGYANASSFIRAFKNVTGRTPGSYRSL